MPGRQWGDGLDEAPEHQAERGFGGRVSRGWGARRALVLELPVVGTHETPAERPWEGSPRPAPSLRFRPHLSQLTAGPSPWERNCRIQVRDQLAASS